MSLPEIVLLSQHEAISYIDVIYQIFNKEVVNGNLFFLELPIICPWSPSYDDKHFCFWHLISEKNETNKEEDRIPDIRRCERIHWIAYVIKNANDRNKIWCWEKDTKTKRGRAKHITLYLHEEKYVVILRRKFNRLELVTTFLKERHGRMSLEKDQYPDPRTL